MYVITGHSDGQQYCAQITLKNSRFLAEAFAVTAQTDARARIKAQKERYPDASHVVHAFVIGRKGEIMGCSDDGEPSGTAGRPALEVLRGAAITDILITVTRWFGGTLLGTGGLVKAYTEATHAVLAATPVTEFIPMRKFSVCVSYEIYERVKRELALFQAGPVTEEFGSEVVISGTVPEDRIADFAARIMDISSGKSAVHFAS